MQEYDFGTLDMYSIYEITMRWSENAKGGDIFSFIACNPDAALGLYAGESCDEEGGQALHRSWKSWTDLADIAYCRMLTPQKLDDKKVRISFCRLNEESFHREKGENPKERYGRGSLFWRIKKGEEPIFHHYFRQALRRVSLEERREILDLGIHRGDEFLFMRSILTDELFRQKKFTGVDHSASATEEARRKLPSDNVDIVESDIGEFIAKERRRYDLVVSIGTLQSGSVDLKRTLMDIVQKLLDENGALLLAFPNLRWIDGEMSYGAVAPNYPHSELSIVIKDIYWIKKYLQQHRFRVSITGREYLFLCATAIRKKR